MAQVINGTSVMQSPFGEFKINPYIVDWNKDAGSIYNSGVLAKQQESYNNPVAAPDTPYAFNQFIYVPDKNITFKNEVVAGIPIPFYQYAVLEDGKGGVVRLNDDEIRIPHVAVGDFAFGSKYQVKVTGNTYLALMSIGVISAKQANSFGTNIAIDSAKKQAMAVGDIYNNSVLAKATNEVENPAISTTTKVIIGGVIVLVALGGIFIFSRRI
jgi:hypothetical protein